MSYPTSENTVDSNASIIFKGPAQQEFKSLKEQALYFLDLYWPNWKDYNDPKSYFIPPTFNFKHAEVNDQNFKNFKKDQQERIVRNPHLGVRFATGVFFDLIDRRSKSIDLLTTSCD